jgi:hypothetical protein
LLGKRFYSELEQCVKGLREYVNNGVEIAEPDFKEASIFEAVEAEKFRSFKPSRPRGRLLSVDASSYPLLTGNNWRIGVSRCAYVVVEVKDEKPVVTSEGYEDHLFQVVCPPSSRPYEVWDKLRRFESELTLKLIKDFDAEDFCLLDGAAYFGGSRSFTLNLYNEAKRRNLQMIMIPKNSPRLKDSKGRDLLANLSLMGVKLKADGKLEEVWTYYPVEMVKVGSLNLYAEVSCVKLSPSSPRVFRCDIIDYLLEENGIETAVRVASQLAYLSRDARCDGYPAPLYLAHQRTRIPESKLLEYEEEIYQRFGEEGILDELLREAEVAGFRKTLLGLLHDYEWFEELPEL